MDNIVRADNPFFNGKYYCYMSEPGIYSVHSGQLKITLDMINNSIETEDVKMHFEFETLDSNYTLDLKPLLPIFDKFVEDYL